MVRDGTTPCPVSSAEVVDEPAKVASALLRRAEQLKRWEESDTNKLNLPVGPAPCQKSRRVKFPDDCVFLAACSGGDLDEVKTLLRKGADVNTTNVDGLTALHQAVIDENLEMVDFLVLNGANVNAQDNEGWTPLMAGVSCDFVDIVRQLLVNGADPVLHNNDGEMPVDLVEGGEMRQLLEQEITKQGINLEEARIREQKQMTEDALVWASSAKIKKLPRHPQSGATSVHVAAAKGYCSALRILLQAGADANAKDNDGWTPLHAAAHWGEREACGILIEHSANLEELNNMGYNCVDVSDADIIPFLEGARENKKSLKTSTNVCGSIAQRRPLPPPPPPCAEPTVPPPTPPSSVQLPAWRLTGRRAPTTPSPQLASAVEPLRSPPPVDPTGPSVGGSIRSLSRPMGSEPQISCPSVCPRPIGRSVDLGQQSVGKSIHQTANVAPKATEPEPQAACPSVRSPTDSAAPPAGPLTQMLSTRLRHDPPSIRGPTSVIGENRSGTTNSPQRVEESEAERKLRAKRERESRRSTQGVTLETVKAAEKFFVDRCTKNCEPQQLVKEKFSQQTEATEMPISQKKICTEVSQPDTNFLCSLKTLDELAAPTTVTFKPAAPAAKRTLTCSIAATSQSQANVRTLEPERDRFVAKSTQRTQLSEKSAEGRTVGPQGSATISGTSASSSTGTVKRGSATTVGLFTTATVETATTCHATHVASASGRVPRRAARTGRRSTGPIDQDDVHAATLADQQHQTTAATEGSNEADPSTKVREAPRRRADMDEAENLGKKADDSKKHHIDGRPLTKSFNCSNLSEYRNNRQSAYVTNFCPTSNNSTGDRILRSTSVISTSSQPGGGQDSEIDYKKLYESEVAENERLKKIIIEMEKSMESAKFGIKQASGDGCHVIPYTNKIEKLVADLEEENKNLEQIRVDNIRLKEENGALIRVISKLSKSK